LGFDQHLSGAMARIGVKPKKEAIADVEDYFFFGGIRQHGPDAVNRADPHRTA
jgi:hypothetical protein